MIGSQRIPVHESSQTAEARRIARTAARNAGLDSNFEERVAIVVTEACTNLLKHAGGGELLLNQTGQGAGDDSGGLELLALDQGPGMADLNLCLRDGYSTGSSPGQGLGAIARLATSCDMYSLPGRGTAILARWADPRTANQLAPATHGLRFGSVCVNKPGQDICGDSWGVAYTDSVCTILVADGLGHGPEASTASMEAVGVLRQFPAFSPAALLERVHLALRATRGAAVAVAQIDYSRAQLTFAGVGNIAAQIYRPGASVQHLVSVNGTAGLQVHKLREFVQPWPGDGILILNSDGLSTSAGVDQQSSLVMHDPSLVAGVLYKDFSRRNDDATVVVAKAA